MITLKEFNAQRRRIYGSAASDSTIVTTYRDEPYYNGIECPECESELVDTGPDIELTSYPPRKTINCLRCQYTGYRIA